MSLHCGACQREFETVERLNFHTEFCIPAKVLLPFINLVMFVGERKVGHPIGSLIYGLNKNHNIVEQYIRAVAGDVNSIERAKIHQKLCDKLSLDKRELKPFEADDIKKLPTIEEAREIFWKAIDDYMKANI